MFESYRIRIFFFLSSVSNGELDALVILGYIRRYRIEETDVVIQTTADSQHQNEIQLRRLKIVQQVCKEREMTLKRFLLSVWK